MPIHLQAIWENQFYYLFGFLFLVFIILVVSCSQISIVMVYFQLCAEVSSLSAYYCLWLPGFYLTYTHHSHFVSYVFHLPGTYVYYVSRTYAQPCLCLPHCQDYRWWWRTFLVSGGSAFYVLVYAVFYFVNKVKTTGLFETLPH